MYFENKQWNNAIFDSFCFFYKTLVDSILIWEAIGMD